jgi:hypothetical protein
MKREWKYGTPAFLTITTPFCYLDWGSMFLERFDRVLVFVWGSFSTYRYEVLFIDFGTHPAFNPIAVSIQAVCSLILGFVLSFIVWWCDNDSHYYTGLKFGSLVMIAQILLPVVIFYLAAMQLIHIILVVPIPIPSIISIVFLFTRKPDIQMSEP